MRRATRRKAAGRPAAFRFWRGCEWRDDNWKLETKLTARSRDNLPNPKHGRDGDLDDYVPRNMPAIGDLFDLFDFGRDDDQGQDHDGGNGQH